MKKTALLLCFITFQSNGMQPAYQNNTAFNLTPYEDAALYSGLAGLALCLSCSVIGCVMKYCKTGEIQQAEIVMVERGSLERLNR